jgi:hypothetical protein
VLDIGIVHVFSLSKLIAKRVDIIGVGLVFFGHLISGAGELTDEVLILLLEHDEGFVKFFDALHFVLEFVGETLDGVLKFFDFGKVMGFECFFVFLEGISHVLNFFLEFFYFFEVVFGGGGFGLLESGDFEFEGEEFVLVVLDVVGQFVDSFRFFILGQFQAFVEALFFSFQFVKRLTEVFVLAIEVFAPFAQDYVLRLFTLLIPDGFV